ncbi:MAG TPA: hypothetical protein DCW90_12115 [Lachnospiraceae bacterium]|nr:GGDEF domain-containing protein [uncultured Lachnoclostridium sp.]HAU86199.1 hypothetical protein [Lachnospiraceae bacterium]
MKKRRVMGTAFFIISFLLIIVYISRNTHTEDVFLGSKEITAETEGWNLSCNSERKGVIQIPAKLEGDKGESVSIMKQISFFNREEQYLCFRSTQNKVWVYVDGELVYTYGVNGTYALSKSPGSAWNVVKLSGLKNSYNVEILLESPYKFYSGKISTVYTGTKTALYTYILRKYVPYFFIGLVVILISIFIFGSYLILKNMKIECGLYLTLTVFHLGLWFLVDSTLSQFMFHTAYCFSQLECLLVLTFPLVLSSYLLSLREFTEDNIMKWAFRASACSVIVETGLVLTRTLDYVEMLPITILLNSIVFIGVISNSYKRWTRQKGISNLNWHNLGVVVMLITGIHDVLIICCDTPLSAGKWFHVGVLFFILIIFMGYEREFATLHLTQLEDERFKVLAYTDGLTGLGNRASFEERMDSIRSNTRESEPVCLVIIDINNLKSINDTLGHKMGDKAIKQVAGSIETVFTKNSFCYRIGGDEFCIIIHKIRRNKAQYLIDKLTHDIRSAYFVEGLSLSVACGYEVYEPSMSESIDDVFVRADKKMYDCKQAMKSSSKKSVDRI